MPFWCFKKTEDEYKVDVRPSITNRSTRERPDKECFFVITAIFNPASFQKRYDLYHEFAQHMQTTGAQLITIECIFPTLNQHEFQVTNSNNPNHIQIRSESVYWVKENLINIAVDRLPPHAKWVCWLDADIHFHDQNWIDRTLQALKQYTVVQVFETADFLGPQNQVLRTDYSFGYSVVFKKPIDQGRYNEWYPHPGYGWAMEKSAFLQMRGLPDYDIVGSGDLHFAFSLLNRVSNAIENDLNPKFKAMIMERSNSVYNELVAVSKAARRYVAGYAPLKISHNWHGSRKNRQYVNRWKILIAHNFNYLTDVTRTKEGLLLLKESKRRQSNQGTSLQEDILVHFERRNEDESDIEPEDTAQVPKPMVKKLPEAKPPGYTEKPGKKKYPGYPRSRSPFRSDRMPPAIGIWDPLPDYVARPDPEVEDPECPYPDEEDCPCPDPCYPDQPGHDHDHHCHDNTGPSYGHEHDHYDHSGYNQDSYANDYGGNIACSSQY